jgi:hypothetical protein
MHWPETGCWSHLTKRPHKCMSIRLQSQSWSWSPKVGEGRGAPWRWARPCKGKCDMRLWGWVQICLTWTVSWWCQVWQICAVCSVWNGFWCWGIPWLTLRNSSPCNLDLHLHIRIGCFDWLSIIIIHVGHVFDGKQFSPGKGSKGLDCSLPGVQRFTTRPEGH